MKSADKRDWESATWEGSRRLQLRRALSLTLRERLQAVEDMAAVSARLQQMPKVYPSNTRSSRK